MALTVDRHRARGDDLARSNRFRRTSRSAYRGPPVSQTIRCDAAHCLALKPSWGWWMILKSVICSLNVFALQEGQGARIGPLAVGLAQVCFGVRQSFSC